MQLISLRSYTAALLEKAIKEIFPQAQLLGSQISEIGYTVEFISKYPPLPETLTILEEKIRGSIKAPPSFRVQEMVPSNAARLFKDKGEFEFQQLAEESDEELVSVLCLDQFYTLTTLPIEQFVGFAIKLIQISVDQDVVKIFGTAFSEKDQVKQFIKIYKEAERTEWKKSGPEGKFLVVGPNNEPLFLPKGLEIQRLLQKRFSLFLSLLPNFPLKEVKSAESWSRPLVESHALMWARLFGSFKKGGFAEWRHNRGITHQFCEESEVDEVVRSSLQFFIETIRILGFEYHGILSGSLAPKFENSKGVKEQWKTAVSVLKNALNNENIEFELSEGRSLGRGPKFSILLFDELGRSFEGPTLSLDCLTSQKLGLVDTPPFIRRFIVATELFPELDSLTLKLIEKYSQNTIKELGR